MLWRTRCREPGSAHAEPRWPHLPVSIDVAYIVRNNIYLYGIRGEGKAPRTAPRH
jgi:hypothetical protein